MAAIFSPQYIGSAAVFSDGTSSGAGPTIPSVGSMGFEMTSGPKKRYYIKRKGRILLFDTARQADEYMAAEKRAEEVAASATRSVKRKATAKLAKAAPVETIELAPVTELLSRFMPNVSAARLVEMRDIEKLLQMQQQALAMQEDEDIEILLLTL